MDLGHRGQGGPGHGGVEGAGAGHRAEALAAEGARVVMTAPGRGGARRPPRTLRGRPGAEVVAVAGRRHRSRGPDRLVAATVERFGGLDIVVANAGGPPPGRALEVDDDAARGGAQRQPADLDPPGARGAAPHAAVAGWGRICCITSYSVVQPVPTLALSNTARTGAVGLGQDGRPGPGRRRVRDHPEHGLSRDRTPPTG